MTVGGEDECPESRDVARPIPGQAHLFFFGSPPGSPPGPGPGGGRGPGGWYGTARRNGGRTIPGTGAGGPAGDSVTKAALAIGGPGHWTKGLARTGPGTRAAAAASKSSTVGTFSSRSAEVSNLGGTGELLGTFTFSGIRLARSRARSLRRSSISESPSRGSGSKSISPLGSQSIPTPPKAKGSPSSLSPLWNSCNFKYSVSDSGCSSL